MNIFCYQHHISDFRRKTHDLSHEQKGVYRDLLDAYYFSGGNLPSDIDQLARIISAQTDSERAAIAYTVERFFVIRSYKLHHKRADEEIDKIKSKSDKAKTAITSRWLKTKDKKKYGRITDEILTKNQEPRTILEDKPPTPLREEKTENVKRKRLGQTYVPEDFRPDLGGIAICSEYGFDVEQQTREFIDYWKSCGKQKSDWQATFRNSVRQAARWRAEREQRGIAGRSKVTSVTEAALRVAARHSQNQQANL